MIKQVYENQKLAKNDLADAESFFRKHIDKALEKLPNDHAEYFDDFGSYVRVVPKDKGLWSRSERCHFEFTIQASTQSRHGYTRLFLRKNGTLNQERIDDAVRVYCAYRRARNMARLAKSVNKELIEQMPNEYRAALEPTETDGVLEVSVSMVNGYTTMKIKAEHACAAVDILRKASADLKKLKDEGNQP